MSVVLLAVLQGTPPVDTVRPRILDPVVVIAERAPRSLSASAAAVTRLSAEQLARMPAVTVADLLRLSPGVTAVSFDGLGYDPQLMVRGFYGGGEAEYVLLQVDGRPVNQLMNGVIAWDVLPPLASIEAIEIIRGGSSPLYGDAALGGVINVITRARPGGARRGDVSAGTHETFRGGVHYGTRGAGLMAGADRTGGFRDHAERTALRAQVTLPLSGGERGGGFTLAAHWRRFQEPGPLLESLLAQDRNGSDPLFAHDETTDRALSASVSATRAIASRLLLSAGAEAALRGIEAIRTLALAPGFGDTRERVAETRRMAVHATLEAGSRLVAGVEAGRGSLDSRYYLSDQGVRGAEDTHAESARSTVALFSQYAIPLGSPVRLTFGGRLDVLHDSFEQGSDDNTVVAFSPRAGLNLRYVEHARGSGSVWVAAGRSFKAPTLDQKYDQRRIPVPFPPFEITTSNPELAPQHGVSVETGIYHTVHPAGSWLASFSLAAYAMEMKDELDFDVETFRYVNLAKSRHRGVEAGTRLDGVRHSAFLSYTLQAATSRTGTTMGKRLKAIPRHTLNAGLSLRPLRRPERLEGTLILLHASGMYLDDANDVVLPDYTRVDGRITLRAAGFQVLAELRNLFGRRYSSTGFLDPSGSGEAYLYPAAGRTLDVGVRRGW